MGTSPFLSVEWKEGNLVKVSCESEGWYPPPQLRWSDQKRDLDPVRLTYSNSSSGLVSVHSWVLVSSSSEVSCLVGLSDGEGKVARVHLANPPEPAKQGKENYLHVRKSLIFFIHFLLWPIDTKSKWFLAFYLDSGSSVAGWVAFALLLIIILALVGLLYFKKRGKYYVIDCHTIRNKIFFIRLRKIKLEVYMVICKGKYVHQHFFLNVPNFLSQATVTNNFNVIN